MLYLNCPYCRSKTQLVSPSADCLPRNKILEDLILEWKRSQVEFSQLCQLCMTDPSSSTSECIACELICCTPCSLDHVSKPRFAHHKILPLWKSKLTVCLDHHLELLWFCNYEKVFLCKSCLDKHQGHFIMTIEQAKVNLVSEVTECKERLKNVASVLRIEKEKLNKEYFNIEAEQEKNLKELELQSNMTINKINEFTENTKNSITNIFGALKSQIIENLNNRTLLELQANSLLRQEDSLQFLNQSYPILNIKEASEPLILPKLIYTPYQPPTVTLCPPSQNLFYLNRGTREFYLYNISTKKLQTKLLSNDSPNISKWSSFTNLSDGRILVTGGKVDRNSGSHRACIIIDPNKLQCYPATPMLKGHSSHISLRIFDKVYVISGKNEDNVCDSFCEVLEIYNQVWVPIGRINFPRTCAAGSYINDSIYVLGGFQNSVCNTIEKYNINNNTWTLLPTLLPEKIWQHGCFTLDSRRVLVFGGEKEVEEPSKVSYIYDITTESFNSTTNIDAIPVYLYFWIQVIREGDYLYSINKEKTLVRYSIPENKWTQADLA